MQDVGLKISILFGVIVAAVFVAGLLVPIGIQDGLYIVLKGWVMVAFVFAFDWIYRRVRN